jgi:protein SCO1
LAIVSSKRSRIAGRCGLWLLASCLAIGAGLAEPSLAQPRAGSEGDAAFAAIDHTGRSFSSASLAGHPYAIFFGFTRCPDVCPTTLLEMSKRLQDLGSDGDRLKVVFVTVDAEHDSPERLREYLASFDSRIIGLTGSAEQIAAIARVWSVFYYKLPEADGSYSFTHSAYVYLMDRNNHRAGTLTFQDSEAEQLAKLKTLLTRP